MGPLAARQSATTDRPRLLQQENTSTICLYTKALSPVMALPTIKVFISRVPS